MQSTSALVEQHIRESEARLRHIDELMARSSQRPIDAAAAPEVHTLLTHTRETRAKLAKELEDLRRGCVNGTDQAMIRRGEGLKSLLEAAGRQFEKTLSGIFDCRGL